MSTVHLLIKGKVQGVYYRASAKEMAQALDLRGWVKNTPEGHVKAIATGPEGALHEFVEWCKKGPAAASVAAVSVTAMTDMSFDGFEIRRR